MAIITDPLTGKLKTEGGLENILNPLVLATKAPETSVSATIIDSDEADEMIEEDKKAGILPDETKIAEEIPKTERQKREELEGYDVDIYKGNESVRINSNTLNDYMAQGWSTTKPTLTPEELAVVGEEETTTKEKTPEELQAEQLDKDIATADSEIVNAQAKIDKIVSSITDDTAYEELGAVRNIRRQYEQRREDVREMGERQKQSLNTLNIRLGTSRYSPLLASGIIDAQERQIMKNLNELKNEEEQEVNAMKAAIRKENYDAYIDLREDLQDTRNKKIAELGKLNDVILEKNNELDKQKIKITNQSKIADLISQGFDKNDVIKRLAGMVDLKEVDEVFDMLLEDSAGLNEEVIDRFTDENGERINVFYNKDTGEIKQLKFGKVQVTGGAEVSQKDIDSWVDLLAKGQTQIYNIPMNIRNEVVSRASEKGVQIISPTFAKASADAVSSFNSAMSQLNLISNQSLKVITATNITEIPAQAAKGLPGVRIAFPEYKIYKDSIDAFLSMLTRAAGEKGVLTNTDVGRIKKALPDLNTDTIYTATEKLKNFKGLLESIKTGAVDAYTAQQFGITPKESATQNNYSGQLKSGEILVKEKSTGRIGAILESEFDDKLYEKINQ